MKKLKRMFRYVEFNVTTLSSDTVPMELKNSQPQQNL